MKYKVLLLATILCLLVQFSVTPAAGAPLADEAGVRSSYMQVSVDRIVVDTAGLASASQTLALSIDRLAHSIERISADGAGLNLEERKTLLDAAKSVDKASIALSELAQQLPLTAQRLTDRLPQVISEARQPIAELSSGLKSASDSLVIITEALPEATENARMLVNSSLDSVLIRFSLYTVILVAILALAVIGVMWFTYRQYLDPLAKKLDALVGAPEHFASMSRHMSETSNNLLALQAEGQRTARPSLQRLTRRG
ncbi:MAG: hypothetical protein OEN02_07155 [Gammaproteobacteria bacterium]|nr:hypothetical protein [Gammaproteobacteria bacterium]MDH3537602.1 hypothetical protein [Gammaproteobacteria bacterium]